MNYILIVVCNIMYNRHTNAGHTRQHVHQYPVNLIFTMLFPQIEDSLRTWWWLSLLQFLFFFFFFRKFKQLHMPNRPKNWVDTFEHLAHSFVRIHQKNVLSQYDRFTCGINELCVGNAYTLYLFLTIERTIFFFIMEINSNI